MSEFKTYNEKGIEIKVTKEDFELVQKDQKIHDVKFESKPTTFWKDAFRRFCKNKSSVVGAYIIGFIVLCAILIPFFSPHNIKTPDLSKRMLPPKIFATGTGFWDGTKKYTNVVYDVENEQPADFKANCVVEVLGTRTEPINVVNPYAHGGTMIFKNDNTYNGNGEYDYNTDADYLENHFPITFNPEFNHIATIKLSNEDGLLGYELGKYRVVLRLLDNQKIQLTDWSQNYNELSLNISEALKNAGITTPVKGHLRFELLPLATGNDKHNHCSYIGINEILITTNNELDKQENIDLINELSFDNANAAVQTQFLESGAFAPGYWKCDGIKLITGASITYVDFIYDWYEHKLGVVNEIVPRSTLDDYIKAGWCEYDYNVGPSSFKILNQKRCPIIEITEQKVSNVDNSITITADVYKYRLSGYKNMPVFIFGTDTNGYDLLTLCFAGLRVSLILAICASAVCITFGLIWGSISGYFGGNVDLIMERFVEILSGVPWTVVMTLAILLMGDGIFTFGLALCLTGWIGIAGRTRTQFYRFKGREYIYASRTLGAKDSRLIFKHILPNAMGTIVTSAVLMIPSSIFSETTLSYLGIGLQGSNSFGNILSKNQSYLSSQASLIVFPAVIISLIMISFNLFGNGLRDALNPSLKGSE